MDITTSEEFESVVMDSLSGVIDDIIDNITKENEDLIDSIVYAAGSPNFYERQVDGQNFKSAWDSENKRTKSNEIDGKFFYEPKNLSLDKSKFVHGSEYNGYSSDVRKVLADIIYEGLSGDLFGEDGYWREPRDAWTPLIKKIEENFDKWVISAFNKHGFECRRSTTGQVLFWK